MDFLTAAIPSQLDPETVLQYGAKLMIIFLITPLHEYAHAWAAVKQGDDTPRLQGRLTLNPFAHIDIIGAVCLFIGGFGWGRPVQVNPLRFRKFRKGMAVTAAAGPIMNMIVGTAGMIMYKFAYYAYWAHLDNQALGWLRLLLFYFTIINFGLAVFNLIPIPPLDGSKIVSYFAGNKYDRFMAEYSYVITIVFFMLIATSVLGVPLGHLRALVFDLVDKLTFFIDIIAKAAFGLS